MEFHSGCSAPYELKRYAFKNACCTSLTDLLGDTLPAVGSSSPVIGPNESITTASIIRSGHLPTPRLGIMGEIEKAIKALARTQAVKERICEYIQQEVRFILAVSEAGTNKTLIQDYLKSMIEVMNVAEDQESLDNLHALCSLMQTIREFNQHLKKIHAFDAVFSNA